MATDDYGRYVRTRIDSVPMLRALYAAALVEAPWAADQIADEIEDVRWRLAVESQRDVARWREDRRCWSDDYWWHIWRGVLARRWSLNARCGPPEGFLPSREVAVRDPGAVVIR